MDFGRSMVRTAGILAKSNLRLVSESHLGNDPLDILVCQSANDAVQDLFLGNDPSRLSGTLYLEQHLPPPRHVIQPGDLVVVFESFNDLNFVYAKPNEIFSNRNGHFHHNDFLYQPYGCKIRSRNNHGLGFLYLLRPTPELWAQSLIHRTQIVHELDASIIVHYLHLLPNMIVCESGTGSGAMSHVLLRSIAPKGKLHTYEFNRVRAEKAWAEFHEHGLGHLVTVHHRDVCGKQTMVSKHDDSLTTTPPLFTNNCPILQEDDGKGGFQLGTSVAHAIFLDLPEPWLAIPHAAHTLQPSGRIGSYSPCMEQTQRTVAALSQHGFHSITTVEARLKEYYVDEWENELPPTDVPALPTEESISLEKERQVGGGVLPNLYTEGEESECVAAEKKTVEGTNKKRKRGKSATTKTTLCARPFHQMRGHTAFLTFATAGNSLRVG